MTSLYVYQVNDPLRSEMSASVDAGVTHRHRSDNPPSAPLENGLVFPVQTT